MYVGYTGTTTGTSQSHVKVDVEASPNMIYKYLKRLCVRQPPSQDSDLCLIALSEQPRRIHSTHNE